MAYRIPNIDDLIYEHGRKAKYHQDQARHVYRHIQKIDVRIRPNWQDLHMDIAERARDELLHANSLIKLKLKWKIK